MAITKITGEVVDLADLSVDLGGVYCLRAAGTGTNRKLELVANPTDDTTCTGGTVVSDIDLSMLVPTYTIRVDNSARMLHLDAQYSGGATTSVASVDLATVYVNIGDIGKT